MSIDTDNRSVSVNSSSCVSSSPEDRGISDRRTERELQTCSKELQWVKCHRRCHVLRTDLSPAVARVDNSEDKNERDANSSSDCVAVADKIMCLNEHFTSQLC